MINTRRDDAHLRGRALQLWWSLALCSAVKDVINERVPAITISWNPGPMLFIFPISVISPHYWRFRVQRQTRREFFVLQFC